MISKKHKQTCKTLNYTKYLLILASTITGCVSISAFTSVVVIPVGIKSSAVRLKTFVIAEWFKISQKSRKREKDMAKWYFEQKLS